MDKSNKLTLKKEICTECGKVDKVFYVNELIRPYLCSKCYGKIYKKDKT